MCRLKSLAAWLLVFCLMLGTVLKASAENPISQKPDSDWSAFWIWDNSNENNTWMNLRKTVFLSSVPQEAVAKIAVDSHYWLYVNGQQVVFEGGLLRGVTSTSGYFDQVDLAPYLKKGENTICVLSWYWGPKSQSYSNTSSGQAGFLFQCQMGDQLVISDDSWRVRRNSAYLDDSKLGVRQPNVRIPAYNIYYDARNALDADWTEASFDDSDWSLATVKGAAPCAPWGDLYLRTVPLIKDYGISSYLNSSDVKGVTTTKTTTFSMQLDINIQLTPYLKIVTDTPGQKIIITTDNTTAANIDSVQSTYVTTAGEQEFEALGWFNGQYINYQIPAGVTILELGYRQSGYDADMTGSFETTDAFYNTLWQKSLNTLYVTMRDNFMDCPDRERAQWWGDVTSEMMEVMYSMDQSAYALYEKGLATKLGWLVTDSEDPGRNDVLQTVVPISGYYYELPMQELAGIVGIWDYYVYSGRDYVCEEMYEACYRYLMKWTMGTNGLISHRGGSWDWMDWGDHSDTTVIENAWYYMALDAVQKMAHVAGDTSIDAEIEYRRSSIYVSYNNLLWTETGYRSPNRSEADPDDRGNALAVLSGLASSDKYDTILQVLTTVYNASPYMERYVEEALAVMGEMEACQQRIRDRYTYMVEYDYSTLWEFWTTSAENGVGTMNHAWTGGPLVIMSKYMVGIAPTSAGYATYQIKPVMGELSQVSASVPSVQGDIVVRAVKNESTASVSMEVVSPEGTQAEIAVPRYAEVNASITVNGETVYAGGAGVENSTGAVYSHEDLNYIYLSAVPGTYQIESAPGKGDTATSHTLTILGEEGGTVTVGGQEVTLPYTLTFTNTFRSIIAAIAAEGYSFVGFTGYYPTTEESFRSSISDDATIRVQFARQEVAPYSTVTLHNLPGSDVTVMYNGKRFTGDTGNLVVATGSQITLTAVDAEDGFYSFRCWSGDYYSADPEIAFTVDGDCSLYLNAAVMLQENFAQGASASASDSLESGSTWSVRNLTDGQIDTGFTTNVLSKNLTTPFTITLDLGTVKTFDKITLYPRTDAVSVTGGSPNFPADFAIQVSMDNQTYTTVKRVQDDTNPFNLPQSYTFDVSTARYLRIQVYQLGEIAADEGTASAYRVQLMEIQLFQTATESNHTLAISGSGQIKVNGTVETLPYIGSFTTEDVIALEGVPADGRAFTGFTGDYTGGQGVIMYLNLRHDVDLTANFTAVTASGGVFISDLTVPAGQATEVAFVSDTPLIWTVEDAVGNPSAIADLQIHADGTVVLFGKLEGTSNLVARTQDGSVSAVALVTVAPEEPALLGDLNQDGKLSVTDVVLLRKAILGENFDDVGDMNQDQKLSVTDVVLLRKAILLGA